MRRYRKTYYLGFLLPALLCLCGCGNLYTGEEMPITGPDDPDTPQWPATEEVPIMIAFTDPSYSILTRGQGPFEADTELGKRNWTNARFHVYAFRSDNPEGMTFATTRQEDSEICLVDGSTQSTPDPEHGREAKLTEYEGGAFFTWTDETEQLYYSSLAQINPFNFFAYHIDDAAVSNFTRGTDDIRFDLEIQDATEIASESDFQHFKDILSNGGFVRCIVAPKNEIKEYTRKYLAELEESAKIYGADALYYAKVENGTLQGGLAKFFKGKEADVIGKTNAKDGDVILFVSSMNWKKCLTSLGSVRNKLGEDLKLKKDTFAFCWIIDFPLFEYNEDEGHWEAAHHMFSMPQAEYIDTLEEDPGRVKGDLYDLVLNGYELASGSIRIHDVELQKRVFRICNFSDEEAEKRFGFLLDCFRYGAPPHGGIAPGIDRLCMILAGKDSIREVIAFPKNTQAMSPMDECPSEVEGKQLEELGIEVKKKDE